jgi:hypothetical protein
MENLPEALKLLGVSTPFIYASATYGLFHYLDSKASGEAKQAISSWLKPLEYAKADVSGAIVELFDRLYTTASSRMAGSVALIMLFRRNVRYFYL